MMQTSKGTNRSVFQPTFGNRPDQYIGRDGVIEQFMAGLQEPVGSRNRCTLFLGQRGMGKTALLLELSDRAALASRGFPYLMQLIGYYLIQYTKEADVLNVAMFGMTAKQWREANPDSKGNIRDGASINELICLSNMENINAVLINDGLPQGERLVKLNKIAIQQMRVLSDNEGRKLLK